jgi:hypothetical protein
MAHACQRGAKHHCHLRSVDSKSGYRIGAEQLIKRTAEQLFSAIRTLRVLL